MTTPHGAKAPQPPYIAITLNDQRELVSFLIQDPPSFMAANPAEYNYSSVALQSLDDRGLPKAPEGIGLAILGTLRILFPDEMAPYAKLVPLLDFERDLHLIQDLITKSMRDQTSMHIPSIDAIIRQVKDDPAAASSATVLAWVDIRKTLEKYPGDKS